MSKLKVQRKQSFERQGYISEKSISQVSRIMKTKLRMWNIGKDLDKTGRKCAACKNEEETIEHITECAEIEPFMGRKVNSEMAAQETVEMTEKLAKFLQDYIEIREMKERD